jgi:ABC-type thiamine transport system ATPase subunit
MIPFLLVYLFIFHGMTTSTVFKETNFVVHLNVSDRIEAGENEKHETQIIQKKKIKHTFTK